MSLGFNEYLESAIEDEILKEYDIYSLDSLPADQVLRIKERYYKALVFYASENADLFY